MRSCLKVQRKYKDPSRHRFDEEYRESKVKPRQFQSDRIKALVFGTIADTQVDQCPDILSDSEELEKGPYTDFVDLTENDSDDDDDKALDYLHFMEEDPVQRIFLHDDEESEESCDEGSYECSAFKKNNTKGSAINSLHAKDITDPVEVIFIESESDEEKLQDSLENSEILSNHSNLPRGAVHWRPKPCLDYWQSPKRARKSRNQLNLEWSTEKNDYPSPFDFRPLILTPQRENKPISNPRLRIRNRLPEGFRLKFRPSLLRQSEQLMQLDHTRFVHAFCTYMHEPKCAVNLMHAFDMAAFENIDLTP